MTIPVTGSVARSVISAPSNTGLAESGALIVSTIQPIANNFEWQRSRIPGGANLHRMDVPLEIGSRAAVPVWTDSVGSAVVMYWAQSQNANNALMFDITQALPHTCSITGYGAVIAPSAGHVGLPTSPTVTLVRRSMLSLPDVPWTILGTSSDSSASVAAYQTPHLVGVSGLTEFSFPVSKSVAYRWGLSIVGETGANYVGGLMVLSVYFEVGP